MTYTLLAIDRRAGLIGAVTTSFSLAVGSSVIAIDPASGAVASQAYTNRRLRRTMLAALRAGTEPSESIRLALRTEALPEYRQLAALDLTGRVAGYSGRASSPWAGHAEAAGAVVVGNFLGGPAVLDAVLEGFARDPSPSGERWAAQAEVPIGVVVGDTPEPVLEAFTMRLLGALRAGEDAGGETRGRQSAALQVAAVQGAGVRGPGEQGARGPGAGEQVARGSGAGEQGARGSGAGEQGAARDHGLDSAGWPPDLAIDLRCDDDPDPVARLGQMVALRFAFPLRTAR